MTPSLLTPADFTEFVAQKFIQTFPQGRFIFVMVNPESPLEPGRDEAEPVLAALSGVMNFEHREAAAAVCGVYLTAKPNRVVRGSELLQEPN